MNNKNTKIEYSRMEMSLRDYFAAHAPDNGYLWQEDWPEGITNNKEKFHEWRRNERVIASYKYADAMLKARKSKNE